MITSSGAMCDICGKYILDIFDDTERVNMFSVKGVEGDLCCHNECKKLVLKIGTDWKKLPQDGALYKAFKKTYDTLKAVEQ